jgi:hypothetical protein
VIHATVGRASPINPLAQPDGCERAEQQQTDQAGEHRQHADALDEVASRIFTPIQPRNTLDARTGTMT